MTNCSKAIDMVSYIFNYCTRICRKIVKCLNVFNVNWHDEIVLLFKRNLERIKIPTFTPINSEILVTHYEVRVQSRNPAVLHSAYARFIDHVVAPTYLLARYICY